MSSTLGSPLETIKLFEDKARLVFKDNGLVLRDGSIEKQSKKWVTVKGERILTGSWYPIPEESTELVGAAREVLVSCEVARLALEREDYNALNADLGRMAQRYVRILNYAQKKTRESRIPEETKKTLRQAAEELAKKEPHLYLKKNGKINKSKVARALEKEFTKPETYRHEERKISRNTIRLLL